MCGCFSVFCPLEFFSIGNLVPLAPLTPRVRPAETQVLCCLQRLLKLELMVRCEKYQRPPLSSSLFMSLGGRGQGLPQLEENTLQRFPKELCELSVGF